MDDAQSAAYVNAQATCALVEALGMAFANAQQFLDEAQKDQDDLPEGYEFKLRYQQKDFDNLLVRYGIHHNAVITMFHER